MTQTIDCFKKLVEECSRSERDYPKLETIKELINIQGWEISTRTLCDNLYYFDENKDCLKRGSSDMKICTDKEMSILKAEKQTLVDRMFNKGDQDNTRLVQMRCRFITKTVDCMLNSDMNLCPRKILDILRTVIYGYVPPRCNDVIPERFKTKLGIEEMEPRIRGQGSGSIVLGNAVIVFLTAVSSGFFVL